MDLKTLFAFVKQSGGWRAALSQASKFKDAAASQNSYNGQENSHLLMIGAMFMLIAIAFLVFVAVPTKIAMNENINKNVAPEENETTEV